MTVHPNDIHRAIDYLEEEHKRCIAKVRDLRLLVASLNLPKPKAGIACDLCGVAKRDEDALRDHLENVHGIAA